MEELIACNTHTCRVGQEYNKKVLRIIHDIISRTLVESSIKAYKRSRSGREAYKELCQHNLGSSNRDNILEDAETYVTKIERN